MRPGERERHVLVEGASLARMLSDDLLLYANAGNLFVVALDRKTLTPRGKPVALEQDVATDVGSGAVQFAVARTGAAVWLTGKLYGSLGAPQWYDRDGDVTPVELSDTFSPWQIALSPDGRQVAARMEATEGADSRDLWVGDLTRGTLTRLTFNEITLEPTWTPDGRRIAYQRRLVEEPAEAEGREIVWRPADGSGEAEVLLTGRGPFFSPDDFSPDGRYLVHQRWTDANASDLWILPLDPPGEPRPFLTTPFDEYAATVSPDCRWLAYQSNESGRFEVYVRPFPDGAGKWQISTDGGVEPHWSPVGGELFYRGEGRMMSVAFETSPTFRPATPRVLWQSPELYRGNNPRTFGVAPDGKRFLAMREIASSRGATVVNYGDDWVNRARRLLRREG